MAKQVLDLYELYNLVVDRGGLVDVINKKLWQEIIKGLKLPSSITSAAFTLRTQYMKYLYPFECEKKSFSNPAELQCAIDGNRREGRRSSYGTYGDMGGQPPLLPLQNFQNFQGTSKSFGF
ncbi:Protein dead ringer, partial [Armadillidium nasatum]